MILLWTLKSLWQARLRVAGSIAAVCMAFLLVTTFRAVWQGETEQLVAYIEHAGADVWVMQPHVSNMHMASSFLSEGKRVQVEKLDGVADVASILYLNTFVAAGDRQWFCYVVGVDEEGQLGGPWSIAAGNAFPRPGQAIVPAVMAQISDIEIGDSIRIADRTLQVSGLSEGTFSVGNPVAFVHATDLAGLLSLVGYDSYLLVRAAAGTSPEDLSRHIMSQVDDVQALPTPVFVNNDRVLAAQMGTELIGLLTGISAVLAAVLVGFSIYLHTSRLRRELAIVKALGFANRHVYATVFFQSIAITLVAYVLAAALAQGLVLVAPRALPILSLKLEPGALLEIGAIGLVVALASALLPARRVGRVDPLTVFHA